MVAGAAAGAGMMAVCLGLLAGGAAALLPLPEARFTLVWTHSVEKGEWHEEWRVVPHGLHGVEARIKGSGAGIDPPPSATLADGWYRWPLDGLVLPRLVLARSQVVADHRLCVGGDCRPLSHYIGGTDAIVLDPCHAP